MNKQKGFTLIELLVVISIIAVLAGIIFSAISSSRAKAADAQVKSSLSEVRKAVEIEQSGGDNYSSAFSQGEVPGMISNLATKLGLNANQYEYGSTATDFAIVFPLKSSSGYWCVDSSGVSKEVTGLLSVNNPKLCTYATRVVLTEYEEENPYICSYANPPQGCNWIPGPNYDPQTICGMILNCSGGDIEQ